MENIKVITIICSFIIIASSYIPSVRKDDFYNDALVNMMTNYADNNGWNMESSSTNIFDGNDVFSRTFYLRITFRNQLRELSSLNNSNTNQISDREKRYLLDYLRKFLRAEISMEDFEHHFQGILNKKMVKFVNNAVKINYLLLLLDTQMSHLLRGVDIPKDNQYRR